MTYVLNMWNTYVLTIKNNSNTLGVGLRVNVKLRKKNSNKYKFLLLKYITF